MMNSTRKPKAPAGAKHSNHAHKVNSAIFTGDAGPATYAIPDDLSAPATTLALLRPSLFITSEEINLVAPQC